MPGRFMRASRASKCLKPAKLPAKSPSALRPISPNHRSFFCCNQCILIRVHGALGLWPIFGLNARETAKRPVSCDSLDECHGTRAEGVSHPAIRVQPGGKYPATSVPAHRGSHKPVLRLVVNATPHQAQFPPPLPVLHLCALTRPCPPGGRCPQGVEGRHFYSKFTTFWVIHYAGPEDRRKLSNHGENDGKKRSSYTLRTKSKTEQTTQ